MLESSFESSTCIGIVEKLSEKGYSFNKRLLCLDGGILSYYSKVPSEAEKGELNIIGVNALGLKPKLSITAKHIKSIKPADKALAQKKKRDYVFVIEFKKSAFITENKKGTSNSKDEIDTKWIFATQDENAYSKWTNCIENSKTSETIKSLDKPLLEEPNIVPKKRPGLTQQSQVEKIPLEVEEEYPPIVEKPKESELLQQSIGTPKTRGSVQETEIKEVFPSKSSFATGEKKAKTQKRVKIGEARVFEDDVEDTKSHEEKMKEKERGVN